MTIEEAWKQLLSTVAVNLTAMIDGRIYSDVLPNNVTLPAAVFLVPSDIPFTAHDGDSGLATAVIQTDFWSDNRLECAQMRAAARADLNGFKGVIGDLHLSVVETGSSPDYNPDLTLKRSITEWRVMYREAVQ